MPAICIRGTSSNVSKEFVRAWAHASVAVLSYHNHPLTRPITITIKPLNRGIAGLHYRADGRIELCSRNSREQMATTILHEFIHECFGDFGAGTNERCTSTLTARLKGDVQVLAAQLLEGTYRRAAYIAHTKMSYRAAAGAGDSYDQDQYTPLGVEDKYCRDVEDTST